MVAPFHEIAHALGESKPVGLQTELCSSIVVAAARRASQGAGRRVQPNTSHTPRLCEHCLTHRSHVASRERHRGIKRLGEALSGGHAAFIKLCKYAGPWYSKRGSTHTQDEHKRGRLCVSLAQLWVATAPEHTQTYTASLQHFASLRIQRLLSHDLVLNAKHRGEA